VILESSWLRRARSDWSGQLWDWLGSIWDKHRGASEWTRPRLHLCSPWAPRNGQPWT